ncbi:hypothetical protein [Pseudomonas viridiflava]|uniref:hypothetical protein n=1 Tax=Pseudomonas viridiflava TaxID=33069 RepID=UPI000F0264EE|nr:hypothetical protein [Pseudomonas viridiflava]
MSKRLEFWGALGTGIYLLAIGLTVLLDLQSLRQLTFNELGDFLAGAFGPIAFLWLVLGFLQQGRELKLSTDALRLQAEELRNSVEQQTRMADAAVQQIYAAGQALELQLQGAERAVTADFEVGVKLKTGRLSDVINKIKILNNRNVAYKVFSEFKGDLPFCGVAQHGTMKEGESVEVELQFEPISGTHEGELDLIYEDVNGVLRIEVFNVKLGGDSWVAFEKLRYKSARLVKA